MVYRSDGPVVRVSASQPVGRGFEPWPSHTKSFKNGTHCLLIWRLMYENDDQGKGTWTPIEPQSIGWLSRPKKWKFGRKWVGPYTVVSRREAANYKIKFQEGKELFVHDNNLVSAMSNLNGTVVCPTPESPKKSVVEQEATVGDGIRVERAQNLRPRNLRQLVNPPVRYGDIVKH